MLTRKLRTGIIFSLVFAFIVLVAVALYADLPRLVMALAEFRWEYLPLILGLTLFNYFWRFIKWEYYLRHLQIGISHTKSLLIFISGLSMAITPGKVGELLKSYLLKREILAPISRTSPIIVAERLTDGIAMLILALAGLALYRFGWEVLLLLLLLGAAGIAFVQNRRIALLFLSFCEQLPGVSRFTHMIRAFYESAYTLLRWRPLLLAILIGLISWSGECAALYFVFIGLGVTPSLALLIKATFILAFSSIVGSASGLPGGLGVAEGSVLGLTRLLVSPSAALGGAATLIIRFCTLWFGLALGVIALFIFHSIQRTPLFGQRNDNKQDSNGMQPAENNKAYVTISTNTGDILV